MLACMLCFCLCGIHTQSYSAGTLSARDLRETSNNEFRTTNNEFRTTSQGVDTLKPLQ